MSEKIEMPELERQLRELAVTDFEKFKQLVTIDMVQVFVCMERQRGLSLQQIANKLAAVGKKMSRIAVHDRCKRC